MKCFILSWLLLLMNCTKADKNSPIISIAEQDGPSELPLFKSSDKTYLNNPDKTDTLCINNIVKAKKDLIRFEGIYVFTLCLGCEVPVYLNELKEILKERNWAFETDDIGCVIIEGQTQGCYKGYVNEKMIEKFGCNYAEVIEKEAENRFLQKILNQNRIIYYLDLEENERPVYKGKGTALENGTLYIAVPSKLIPNVEDVKMSISFIVEKNGMQTHFKLEYWPPDATELKWLKKELWLTAMETIRKDYYQWSSGTYKKHKVRTKMTLDIQFKLLKL